jgi:hypothetical protein
MIEYPIIKERIIMNTEKTFYIVYYAKKHKKHITRLGKHDEKSRYGTSKKGVPYYVYYDMDAHNYRCASGSWKVRSA